MECPKCHKNISENTLVCPYCHKVLALTCPNCHSVSQSAVCTKCGYIILEKCSKCGKMTPTSHERCKCGFPTASSVAYNECEIDEFASMIINFGALKNIRNLLGSQELYAKFLVKLKNLVTAQIKDMGAHVITYGNVYTVNFNKELSFATSVNKAVRLALKIATVFTGLNVNLIEQFGTSLKLTITIVRKSAEELLVNKSFESNVKLMVLKSEDKKYIRGMQVIVDQYCQDNLQNYKTDSLYSLELNGASIMFYEVILDNYIVPPTEEEDAPIDISLKNIRKIQYDEQAQEDIYGFKVFDINAKCKFQKSTAEGLLKELDVNNKILAIRTSKENCVNVYDLIKQYEGMGCKPIYVSCSEELCYKPWGLLEKIFKQYFNLSSTNGLIDSSFNAKKFNAYKKLLLGQSASIPRAEDARFTYLEQFVELFSELKKYVVIIDGFENIDDTSLQALELYFDKYMKVYTNFVFITNSDVAVHSKIKSLLQTFLYREITIVPDTMDGILSGVKEDASDFIQSFYYERIKENFDGSKLYFDNAVRYLMDKDVLVNFENKLLIKNNSSVMLPKDLHTLLRARLKSLVKFQDASMMLAYSAFLGERLDYKTLETLGINNINDNVALLNSTGMTFSDNNVIYVSNYNLMQPVILDSLKPEVQEFLLKTILAKLGKLLDNTTLLILMGKLSMFKEEYMLLWKNAQMSISSGDYDAYLKNCLAYLSILDKISENVSEEDVESNKKEIFQNILMSLYAYSPSKIYSIENILLIDAMNSGDNEKIIKLSNLMLQGALISSNYTEALTLLHNILTRMPNPSLIVDGVVNVKFLLLSLVNIEILFNIGDYSGCIDATEEILGVITPEILPKIKPANFSTNLFVTHLMDTFRLTAIAKLLRNDDDMDDYVAKVNKSLDSELPEKECIIAVKEYLAGKTYAPSNVEMTTAFSKIVYLILQEISNVNGNYKLFAQNIYQAKLLSVDIHEAQLEYLCDILIGYAYAKMGVTQKADVIINDVLKKAEDSAIFNIVVISRYLLAKNKLLQNEPEEALILINDTLADIQRRGNQAKVFYAMFERLFIDIAEHRKSLSVDIKSELHKLMQIAPNGELERIICSAEFASRLEEPVEVKKEFIEEPPAPPADDEPTPEEEADDLAEMAESFADDDLSTETHK